MRCQVSDILGSENCIEMLEAIEDTESEVYDSQLMKFIDYLWARHYNKALAFNLIYIIYPLILTIITITVEKDLTENKIFGLILAISLLLIEFYQMHLGGLLDYFTTIQNVFDFCGMSSTIFFYAFGD